jgi:hypothetical protein
MKSNSGRVVPFFRIGELSPPFSKSWVKRRIADGDLQAVRIGGLVLIPEASLAALLGRAETWRGDGAA